MNKIILSQNVDLMKDKSYWQIKCEKKDVKVKELKCKLEEFKFQADHVQHNLTQDPLEAQMAGSVVDSD